MNMETVNFSETLVYFYQTKQRYRSSCPELLKFWFLFWRCSIRFSANTPANLMRLSVVFHSSSKEMPALYYRLDWSNENTMDLYLGRAWFESRARQLYRLNCFVFFFQSVQANAEVVTGVDHYLFLSSPYQFTPHLSFYHPRLCSLTTDIVI